MTPNNFVISGNNKIWIMKHREIEVHGLDSQLDYVINGKDGRLMRTHDIDNATRSRDGKYLYFTELGHIFAKKMYPGHMVEQVLNLPHLIEKYKILPDGEALYILQRQSGPRAKHALHVAHLEMQHRPLALLAVDGEIEDFKVYKSFNAVKQKFLVLVLWRGGGQTKITEVVFGYDVYMHVNISRSSEIFSVKSEQELPKNAGVSYNSVKEFIYNKHNETVYVFNIKETISQKTKNISLEISTKNIRFQNLIEIGDFYSELSAENWLRRTYSLAGNTRVNRVEILGFQLKQSKRTGFLFKSEHHNVINKILNEGASFQLIKIYEDNERQFIKVNHLKNRFYVLKNNLLSVFRLETGDFLMEIRLKFSNFEPRFHMQKDLLIIFEYDRRKRRIKLRHEFDLDNLVETQHTRIFANRAIIEAECVNLDASHSLATNRMETYYEPFRGCEVPKELAWDVANVPIGFIPDLFRKEKYRRSLTFFANFYFSFISSFGGKDRVFGVLNPLFICVYHNDSTLLAKLLDRHFYPEFPKNSHFSPLKYAFDMKYFACISSICEYALKPDAVLPRFTQDEFHCLLTSNKPICHMVLSRLFGIVDSALVPNFIQMKGNFKFDAKSSLMEYIQDNILEKGGPHTVRESDDPQSSDYRGLGSKDYQNQNPRKFVFDSDFNRDLEHSLDGSQFADQRDPSESFSSRPAKKIDYYKHKNKNDPKEVDTFRLNLKIDTSLGSKEMIYFLYHYSNSKCIEFVGSKWRFLMLDRWSRFWPMHFVVALFYWVFTFCVALMIIFDTKMSGLYVTNFSLTLVLFLLLFLRFLGFIRIKRYS